MRHIQFPDAAAIKVICQRPTIDEGSLTTTVEEIIATVRIRGDEALLDFAQHFDSVSLSALQVSEEEKRSAEISDELKKAILLAKKNIEAFHQSQLAEEEPIETMPGVRCWRKSIPIQKVGLYTPGGSAPLFSTVLMLGVPAMLASCGQVVLCTPPDQQGKVHPAILYTADLLGITEIYKVGGAQAIAAMAYGTESIPQVDKIFGPGNQYVTKAKQLVQQESTAIDMPAGPSEVLVIADRTAVPSYVAADLLSQAEHGADSQVILLSDSAELVDEVLSQIQVQLLDLPRIDIASKALENSVAVTCSSLMACMEISNQFAPEHLILATRDNDALVSNLKNAGSVFLGNYSCESAGDYASGTNHTLPTNGYARAYSGVSIDSFVKKVTFQELSAVGLSTIGPAIEVMADAEQLFAHKNAVSLRLKDLRNVQS